MPVAAHEESPGRTWDCRQKDDQRSRSCFPGCHGVTHRAAYELIRVSDAVGRSVCVSRTSAAQANSDTK